MGNSIISALGAGSGIDTKKLAESLVAAERNAPEKRLDSNKEKLEAQISAYGTLKSSLEEFKKVLDPLTNPDFFKDRTANIDQTNGLILGDELHPGAQTGSFSLKVEQVARAQSLATAGVADAGTQLLSAADGEQTITINFGDWGNYNSGTGRPSGFVQNADKESVELKLTAGTSSLEDIAKALNATDSGLQATIIDVGDGTSRLSLIAASGAKQEVQIQVSSSKLSLLEFDDTATTSMEQLQEGQDAVVHVNNLRVQRSSNTMDDVVQGFEFTVLKADMSEEVNFSIEPQKASAEQGIRDFVEAFNVFAETADNLIGVTEDAETKKKKAGALSADGAAKQLISEITRMKSRTIEGLAGNYTMLANIGIKTTQDGGLDIDEDDFKDALKNHFDDVANLFAQSNTSSSSALDAKLRTSKTPADGEYKVEITQDPKKASVTTGAVDVAGTFPMDTGYRVPAGNYVFKMDYYGTETDWIRLPDYTTYNSPDEVAEALEAAINESDVVKNNSSKTRALGVDVRFDSGSSQFVFEAKAYGGGDTAPGGFSFTLQSPTFESEFKTRASAGASTELGQDLVGKVNGESIEASGQYGNLLYPPSDNAASGFMFYASPGSIGEHTVNFSTGFAGNLVESLNALLDKAGTISQREERINKDIKDIDADKEKLDTRMKKQLLRYQDQFIMMDKILKSMEKAENQIKSIVQIFEADKN